jgi:succinate dehydrogenase / fumarate reductase membrane anchor subunit
MSFRTDRQRATGLGAAGEGAAHWWLQRVSAVALVPLAPLFLFPFVSALGTSHEAVLALYRHPFHAIVAILTLGCGFFHARLGLQVVIEDYVGGGSGGGARTAVLLANTLLCWLLALTGVFAVARIALG